MPKIGDLTLPLHTKKRLAVWRKRARRARLASSLRVRQVPAPKSQTKRIGRSSWRTLPHCLQMRNCLQMARPAQHTTLGIAFDFADCLIGRVEADRLTSLTEHVDLRQVAP